MKSGMASFIPVVVKNVLLISFDSRGALLGQPGEDICLAVPLGVSIENDAGRVLGEKNSFTVIL